MKKEDIQTFRDTGLLMFINIFLHIFGWAIVIEIDKDGNYTMNPYKVDYCGFDNDSQDKNYKKIRDYMKNFVNEL